MARFIELGVAPDNLNGIDILPDRVEVGRQRYPQMHLRSGNAEHLPYPDAEFDLTMESTMFATLPHQRLRQGIADEMLRVTKPGGLILLVDWRYSKPRSRDHRRLTKGMIRELFDVPGSSKIAGVERGALIPPVGRFISRRAPAGYFPVQALLPVLVGVNVTLLRRSFG